MYYLADKGAINKKYSRKKIILFHLLNFDRAMLYKLFQKIQNHKEDMSE